MPVKRLYCPTVKSQDKEATLQEHEHRHLKAALRAKPGQTVELFNGKGDLFEAKIKEIQKDKTTLEIKSHSHFEKPPYQITLIQAFIRPHKLDDLIDPICQMGVDEILFFPVLRAGVHLRMLVYR